GAQVVPLTAAVLSVANLVFALLWLPESLSPEIRKTSREAVWFDPAALGQLARNQVLLGLMLLLFLVTACFSMMESTLALYCQDAFRWNQQQTGYLFGYIGVLLVLVQ